MRSRIVWGMISPMLLALVFFGQSCVGMPGAGIKSENELTKDALLMAGAVAGAMSRTADLEQRILVVSFADPKGRYTYLGVYLAEKLSEELAAMKGIHIVNRADLALIMGEVEFQQSGLVSDKDVVKLGGLSGADVLVTGSMTDLGDEIDVTMRATKIATGELTPVSYRIRKSAHKMELVNAINRAEIEKEKALLEEIRQLDAEIAEKRDELAALCRSGLADVKRKVDEELAAKRAELADYYTRQKAEIEAQVAKETSEGRQKLVALDKQIRDKSDVLVKLREKEKQLAAYDTEIGRINLRIAKQNNVVKNFLTRGMTERDIMQLLGIRTVNIGLQYGGPWESAFGSNWVSAHGDYLIVWSDLSDGIVLGWCERDTGECYTRSATQ